ncbi:MAG: hypothetical protein R3242_08730 [Akkermansiaceae bacterium]|nr:hypothetical protein [Akkermansiaceae bacterium]
MHRPALNFALMGTLACLGMSDLQGQQVDLADPKRELALDRLLSERGPVEDLQRAVDLARKAGVTEQAILEARFLYHIDQLEDAAIAAMLPEFIERQKHFRIEDSAIFAVEEDWLSVVEYVKAIHALEEGDREAFKRHIKEAFWLGPRQAAAFAPHIERLRHEEAMRAIQFDFGRKLAAVDGSEAVALDSLIEDHKAMLIHFWSPNSRECMMSMPDFARTAEALDAAQIAVVSLCAQRSPDAETAIEEFNQGKHGVWLVDPDEDSLGRLLRVQNLPSMALINPEGKVLYCGDPTDMQFWKTLEDVAPGMKRPELGDEFE